MNDKLALLLLALPLSGCAIEEVTTEIHLRDPSRATLVRTDVMGPRRMSVPADVVMHGPADATITPEVLRGATFTIQWCTPLYGEPRGDHPEFSVMERECVEEPFPGSVGYSLDTPWENVHVLERRRPERGPAAAIAVTSALAFGALAATAFLVTPKPGKEGAMIAAGVLSTVAGVGYTGAMIPTLVAPDLDRVIIDYERPRYTAIVRE